MRNSAVLCGVLGLAVGLAGCGSGSDNTGYTEADTTAPQPTADELSSTSPLGDRDLVRVCKAGIAFRSARSVAGIAAKITGSQQVRLSYDRDTDGKHFDYDCLVEGSVLRFRMIDEAGPGTGPGVWSGRGSKTTYRLNAKSVDVNDDYFDESSDSKTIHI